MIYAEYHFPSDLLGRTLTVHVLLPRQRNLLCPAPTAVPPGGYRCLWLLHGLGDDGGTVLRSSGIADLCDGLNLAVVLPDVENSFCLDTSPQARWGSYLLEELIPWTLEALPLSPRREDHILGGISMGGYGACALALKQPELFFKVLVLSGGLDLRVVLRYARLCRIPVPQTLSDAMNPEASSEWEPRSWLRQCDPKPAPAFRLFCGDRDVLRKSNAAFAELAGELGFDIKLTLSPGDHDWTFWQGALREGLAWAMQ